MGYKTFQKLHAVNAFLIFGHSLIICASVTLMIKRYISNPKQIYTNYLFYMLFFGLFYISFPSMLSLIIQFSVVGASLDTIVNTATIGLYFMLVFFVGYWVSGNINVCIPHNFLISQKKIRVVPFLLAVIIFNYVFYVIIINLNYISNIYGNRLAQSVFNEYLENAFKIKPIYNLQIMIVTYLYLTRPKNIYILLLLPYFLLDLFLSGRGYLFTILVLYFFLNVLKGKILKIRYIVLIVCAVASISIFRASLSEFKLSSIASIYGEFIYTWSTTHLIYESSINFDFLYALTYSFMRILPSGLYEIVFGKYISYSSIISDVNPLGWGLAGSIVAEAISFKNNLIILIYPITMVLYGILQNLFLKSRTMSGFTLFILSLVYLQEIFRFSFMEFALYPLYNLLFVGSWLVILDLMHRTTCTNFVGIAD